MILRKNRKLKTNLIRITNDAVRTMVKQARLSSVETGGILLGTLDPAIAIVVAGCPGENAIHRVTQFRSDPEADKIHLANARQEHGDCISPIGWWHKHPAGLSCPSSGDRQQMRRLAGEYADGKPVIAGIINQIPMIIGQKTTLHLYSIDSKNELIEHDWKLIGRHNQQLQHTLKAAPRRPDIQPGGFWDNKLFRSYLNPIGRERIRTEVAVLRGMGWKVIIGRRPHDHVMVLKLVKNSIYLQFVLPPEFPLNSPQVFTMDGRSFHSLRILRQWSSLRNLSEVAQEAERVTSCPHCRKQHLDGDFIHAIDDAKGGDCCVK